MGALAAVRRGKVDPRALEWLDRKLALVVRPRSLSMAAAGVLAAARGRKETTRRLFHAIDAVSPNSPRVARSVARSWLVADAAERGAWDEVVTLGRPGFKAIRWPRAMGAIARRLTSMPKAAPDVVLVIAWLAAPHRLATFPLLRRAFKVPRRTESAPSPRLVASVQPADPLATALLAHRAALRSPTETSLVAAGRAWDALSASPQVHSLLGRRALALETQTSPELAVTRLLDTAEADLAPFIARIPSSILSESETLAGASRRARRDAMVEIETLAGAMAQRTARKEPLHVSGEWMEWGALRRSCDRIVSDAGPDVRRAVFATVYGPACNHAVWLFNVRGEKLLANGMFRWLATEARRVNDETALKLLEKNVKAGEGA
jgi:hypothetical protein